MICIVSDTQTTLCSVFPQTAMGSIISVRLIASTQGFWPLKAWQETFGCQLTNAPLGFSFHAQTCSV